MLVDKAIKNSKYKAICFDTETESLNLMISRPWQICWADFDAFKIGKFENHFLKWPDLNVGEGAKKVTGFNLEKHNKIAKPAGEILEKFSKVLSDEQYIIVGHNLFGFDLYQVKNAFEQFQINVDWSSILLRCVDTLALGKARKANIEPPKNMTPLQRYSWQKKIINDIDIRGVKLSDCVNNFDKGKLHDA